MIKIPLTPNFKTAALDYSFMVTSSFPFKGNYIKGRVWGFHPLYFPYYVRSTEDSQSELVMPLEFWDGGTEALDLSWQYATAHHPFYSFLAEFHKQLLWVWHYARHWESKIGKVMWSLLLKTFSVSWWVCMAGWWGAVIPEYRLFPIVCQKIHHMAARSYFARFFLQGDSSRGSHGPGSLLQGAGAD